MIKLIWLLRLIGAIQLLLGVLYLFAPEFLLQSMGHSVPNADIFYPLAMLAARFIAYGIAFIYISRQAHIHRLWLDLMILIQAIDLGAGVFYTFTHTVSLQLSGFPMFNACWIMLLLWLWRPTDTARAMPAK